MFEEQTGAKTEFAQFPAGEYDVKYSSLLVAEDSSVDVMYQWEAVIGKYGPVLLEDITGKVSQPILDDTVAAAQAAVMWQGKQYGVPFDSNMAIFLWNTDLYTAAGLDPATPPQNWTEFLEFSTKLTSGDTYGTMIPPEFFHYAVMINSTGGPALSPDLKTVLADSAESQLALQSMSDLFASGANDPISLSVPNSIEQGKNFRAGRFGHYFGFPNHFNLAQDETQSQIVGKVAHGIIPGITTRSGTGTTACTSTGPGTTARTSARISGRISGRTAAAERRGSPQKVKHRVTLSLAVDPGAAHARTSARPGRTHPAHRTRPLGRGPGEVRGPAYGGADGARRRRARPDDALRGGPRAPARERGRPRPEHRADEGQALRRRRHR